MFYINSWFRVILFLMRNFVYLPHMKGIIRILIALFLSLGLFGCAEKSTQEYTVTYRVYYTDSVVKTYTRTVSLEGDNDLCLSSYKGSNSLMIRKHNSLGVREWILETTAPIELLEYSDNFVRVY